jgi:hypothetical protein
VDSQPQPFGDAPVFTGIPLEMLADMLHPDHGDSL